MAETASRWRDPRAWGLAAWGAAVAALGFPPTGVWALALVLPAPLWAAALGVSPRRGFLLGWIQGFGFFATLLWWIARTVAAYGGLPWPAAAACVGLLAGYLALYPGICGWLCAVLGRRAPAAALATAPLVWTAAEALRGRFLGGFPWGDIPQALWAWPPALALAPWVGTDGIRLAAAALAVGPAWGLARAGRGGTPGAAVLAVPLAAAVGWAALAQRPAPLSPAAATIRVGVVQGNIDQAVKWDKAYRTATLERYERLSRGLRPRPDLIVWPETAVPLYAQDPGPERARIERLARELGAWILFGAPAYERRRGAVEYRNAVFLMAPDGALAGRYDKVHLVPFGEYVPLGRYLPFLKKLVEGAGDFSPGDGVRPLRAPGLAPVGPLICFESIFPSLAAAHAGAGARLLAVVTNDAWFGRTAGPYHHLAFAALRAAETGLSLVRAANTGVSAAFDRRGRMLRATELGTPDAFVAEVPLGTGPPPPQVRVRPWIPPACLALAGAVVFAILRRPRRPGDPGAPRR